ncbi:selenocysteine-specific translation elongation factor [Acidobacteria bacterium ACD]|nr:MAG: selenocysteine-specific translation elongation factor [Acidobacteriota bacterium]MDL1948643.1 selenocysteine-specific translation elongation factor [Acidobacteria bacterium ACD]
MNRVLVGTAGHIDHGKSALVRALTGTDPDRLPEEKARGITIDLGFAHASWDGVVFSFVDVPGHERFVKTMVAGATGIDAALLVVASDDSVMPQTREHLSILSLLGVPEGILVRTKADLVDEETGAVVEAEARDLVRGTFLEGAPLVAVSALTGRGIPELRRALSELASRVKGRDPRSRPERLFVDRAFAMKGFGPVVTGTLDGGRLKREDRLVLWPSGREVRVRRLEVHGEERAEAFAGERTSLNLAGVELSDLARGQALAAPGTVVPSTLLTVEATLLPSAGGPLAPGTRLRLHHGTSDVEARLHLSPVEGTEPAREIRPGETRVVQLLLREPVAALRGDRFVLRRPSPVETLGGGRVLDTARPRATRANPVPARAVPVLRSGNVEEAAALLVEESGARGLGGDELAPRLGVPRWRAAELLTALQASGKALRLSPGRLAPVAALARMQSRAGELFEERKRSGAPSPLLPRGEFLSRFGAGLTAEAAEGWLALLAASGKLVVEGDQVGPPGTRAGQVAEESSGFAARIAEAYRKARFEAPKSFDLAREVGTKPAVVDGLVSHLLKTGVLLRLSPDVVVHRDAVEEAAGKLPSVKGKTLTVGDFRDLLGLTRKTLIPLLEHFDRKKLTRRQGDVRLVE